MTLHIVYEATNSICANRIYLDARVNDFFLDYHGTSDYMQSYPVYCPRFFQVKSAKFYFLNSEIKRISSCANMIDSDEFSNHSMKGQKCRG
jgi:hypothetical protein